MMLPTHAFAGMALALPFALAMPEVGSIALVAGLLGGVIPDLDLYVGHRRSLHYPVCYSVLALVVLPFSLLVPTSLTIAAAWLLLGAAVHSISDIFGGGLELRPWEASSNRAVYNHYRKQWIAPRRWVRYDGSPEDLLLSITLAVPLLLVLDGAMYWVVFLGLLVAALYTIIRRILPAVAELLVRQLHTTPIANPMIAFIPSRYLDGPSGGARRSSVTNR